MAGDYIYATRAGDKTKELFYKTDGTKISKAEFDKATDGWKRPYDEKYHYGVSPDARSNIWGFYRMDVDPYAKVTLDKTCAFTVTPPKDLDRPSDKDKNRFFCENLMVVSRSGAYGAIDKTGKLVIPIEYSQLSNSSGGYLSFHKGSEYGVMKNPLHEQVNPRATAPATSTAPSATTAPSTSATPSTPAKATKPGTPAAAPSKPSTSAVTPAKPTATAEKSAPKVGEIVTKRISKRDDETGCGLRAAQIDWNLWGYVDAKDKLVLSNKYKKAGTFAETSGLAAVAFEDGKENIIDIKGAKILPQNYDGVMDPHIHSQALYGFNFTGKSGDADFYYYDLKGNPISEDLYRTLVILPEVGACVTAKIDFRWKESAGLTAVKIGDYQGYVDKKDILVIPCVYQSAGTFNGVLKVARITLANGEQNMIDLNGNHILKQNYDEVSETLQGEILAFNYPPGATKTEHLFFDLNGKLLRAVKDVPIPKWAQR